MSPTIAKKFSATLAAVFITATPVSANVLEENEKDKSIAAGMGAGVLVGSLVAGPAGAVIAGVVGAMLGNDVAQQKELALTAKALNSSEQARLESQQQLLAMRDAFRALDQEATTTRVNFTQDTSEALTLQSSIQFQTGSVEIDSTYAPQLVLIKKAMMADPSLELRLTGHADNRGDERYNQALSMQRALSVKNYLTKQGVDGARILTVAVGEKASNGQSLETAFFDRKVVLEINSNQQILTASK